jgi:GNAT superfamily N-acetyltransferase
LTVAVEPVRTGRDLERFIAFPYTLHRRDPQWVPPLRMDVRTILSPKKNPFFEHASARYFLAWRNGDIVGRIAAIKNDSHNTLHKDNVGFYGFYESIDDQAVATALFDQAAAWLRERGLDTMRGPMNPSINDECGLLVQGFEKPPVVLMPHNPAYYVPLHEAYGFRKAKDLIAFWGGGEQPMEPPERFVRASKVLAERLGVTLRPLDMKRFHEEVELVKSLFNEAWEQNWGYVPMTDAELEHLAKQLKPIIIADLVVFAEVRGRVVGFGVCIPDFNVALKHNPSGRLFPGLLKILWYSRKIDRARIPLLGMVKEYRGKGIDALLYHWIWTHATARGMPQGEAGWILEDNAPMVNGLMRLGFRPYKTYRIFDKPL